MQTMNQSLAEVVRRRLISREDALNRSTNPEELQQLLQHDGAAGTAPPNAAAASPFARR
jgi:twitching motility protein PilT